MSIQGFDGVAVVAGEPEARHQKTALAKSIFIDTTMADIEKSHICIYTPYSEGSTVACRVRRAGGALCGGGVACVGVRWEYVHAHFLNNTTTSSGPASVLGSLMVRSMFRARSHMWFHNSMREAAVLATSLLDGRLGNILKARRGEGEPERVRKPISCDLYTEVLFIVLMVAIGCYCLAVLMNIFGWAMATGRGKCTHDMKPGVDLCDFVRVFSPIELPLVTVQEYINVGIFVASCAVYPLWTFMNMPFEYRFHQKDVVEEVLFAGWQSQASTMVVQGDIEAMEMVWGTMEKYIRATVRAIYIVKQGIAKPFEVTARFAQTDMKIGLVDNDCASCSGHRAKALSYKESIVRALNETKPGHLPLPEAEAEA